MTVTAMAYRVFKIVVLQERRPVHAGELRPLDALLFVKRRSVFDSPRSGDA